MTASADAGEQLQFNRVPRLHYLKTLCEWLYYFSFFYNVPNGYG